MRSAVLSVPGRRGSLAAEARGSRAGRQVSNDLLGVANALAILREDTDALQVASLAESEGRDLGWAAGEDTESLHGDAIAAAQERLGAAVAADLRARGRAVRAGNRVTVACSWPGPDNRLDNPVRGGPAAHRCARTLTQFLVATHLVTNA